MGTNLDKKPLEDYVWGSSSIDINGYCCGAHIRKALEDLLKKTDKELAGDFIPEKCENI